jgi:hypothetical protein
MLMKYKFIVYFLCMGIAFSVKAQLTDLARVEYTYFPQGDSENSFKRFRAFVNVPFQVDDDAYIVAGFEYRNVFLKLEDMSPFPASDLERYQNFTTTLGFTDKLESGWRYALQAEFRLASNFVSKVTSDDFILGGSIFAIRDKTGRDDNVRKPWRLVIGLNYSTTAGRPFPLPFINYYREFAPKWTFGAGIPKSNIKYELAPNMKLQGFVTLDGFFANIQDNIEINDGSGRIGENISMTTLLSGIGYEYEFIDHVLFFVYGGYTLLNDIRIDDGDYNEVFIINDTNSFYTRGGIKLKI